MEYFGVLAFILVVAYSGYPSKVTKLEKKVKSIIKKMKGEMGVSKLVNDLKGEKCLISCDEVIWQGKTSIECQVVDVDDEWIKIIFKDKKGIDKTKIIRIDSIDSIEIVDTSY